MEGLFKTGTAVPLLLGGLLLRRRAALRASRPVGACRCWSMHDPNGEVIGLEECAPGLLRPPVNVVHLAYNVMVGLRFRSSCCSSLWLGWSWWRRRRMPPRLWFLRGGRALRSRWWCVANGGRLDHHRGRPAALHRLRGAGAPRTRRVRPPGLFLGFYAVLVIYVAAHRAGPSTCCAASPARTRPPRAAGAETVRTRSGSRRRRPRRDDPRGGGARGDVPRADRLRAVRRGRLRGRHLGPAGRRHPARPSASAT